MQKEELLALIKSRRSIYAKQYTGEKIPNRIVEEMLEAANWAPTHKLTEPWRFKIFSGESLKKLLAYQKQLYIETTKPEDIKESKLKTFDDVPNQASHLIAVILHRNEAVPEIEEICSVAMAVQNLWLTVSAYGYGGYWSTGGGTYNPKMKQWLNIDEKDKLMGFFYLGVPDGHIQQGKRAPLADKIEWM